MAGKLREKMSGRVSDGAGGECFVPHPHCVVSSGECFTEGKCLGRCTAQRKKSLETRFAAMERRMLAMELELVQLRSAAHGKT